MCRTLSAASHCLIEVAHGLTCDEWRTRKLERFTEQATICPHGPTLRSISPEEQNEVVASPVAQYVLPCHDTSCSAFKGLREKRTRDAWVVHKNWPRAINDAVIARVAGEQPVIVSKNGELVNLSDEKPPSLHVLAPCRTHQLMLALIACSVQGLGVPSPGDAFVPVDCLHPAEVPVVPWRETEADALRGHAAGRLNAVFERPWLRGHDIACPVRTHGLTTVAMVSSLPAREELIGPTYCCRIPEFWGFDPSTKEPLLTLLEMPDPACLISPALTADVVMSVADHLAKPRLLSPFAEALPGEKHIFLLADHHNFTNERGATPLTSFTPSLELDAAAVNRRALAYRTTNGLVMPVPIVGRLRQLAVLTHAVASHQTAAVIMRLFTRFPEDRQDDAELRLQLRTQVVGNSANLLPYTDPFRNALVHWF
ncbi:hypothetical protein AURDEDRAFT_159824 [Auricularia subglabra TFB-10046 SS5]|nr:hypothetical protein AURDEDRAFT_159824 [Auricularia subglabra TFB-10046 SS5]